MKAPWSRAFARILRSLRPVPVRIVRPVRPAPMFPSRHANGECWIRGRLYGRPAGSSPDGGDVDLTLPGSLAREVDDPADHPSWYASAMVVASRAVRGTDVEPGDLVAELWLRSIQTPTVAVARSTSTLIAADRAAEAVAVAERRAVRAAKSLARDLERRERAQRGQGARGTRRCGGDASRVVAPGTDPSVLVDVERAIGTLAPDIQPIVYAVEILGLTQAEAAEENGVKQCTVSRILADANARMGRAVAPAAH